MTSKVLHRWRRYPKYKPSGVEWLGEVPEGWTQLRLRFLCSITTGSKNTEDSDPLGQYPFFVRSDKIERLNTYTFDEEAVITAGDGVGVAKVFHYYNGKFDVHQRVYVLTKFKGILGVFLFFYFRQNLADEVLKLSAKSTVDSLRLPMLQNLPVLVPSIPEQSAIATFLDRETARIDALIAKKERQIELLTEKRAALISHAVTKGLDPTVPMKDSGVEWIGDVPEKWKVLKIKFVASLHSCHTPSRLHPEYWEDCSIPWFSLGDVWQLRDGRCEYLRETKEKISELGLRNSAAELLPAGTVIVSRTASVGFSGIMPVPMATTQDFANWVCGPRLLPEFLLYVFRAMSEEFSRLKMGSTHQTIYMPDIEKFRTPLPSINEQRKIIEFVQTEKNRSEKIENLIESSLLKLREYRSALISAAVTGKIDVRQEAKA